MRRLFTFHFSLFTSKIALLSVALFLLPWQTHLLLFDGTILGGNVTSPFTSIKIYAVEVLVVLAGIIALAIKKERPTIDATYRTPIALACCVFAVAALSVIWSVSYPVSLGALLHIGVAMLFFVLMLDKKLALRPLLFAFGAGLVIPSLLGIWQVLADASPASTLLGLAERSAATLGDAVTIADDGTRQLRAYGSFSHSNVFGGYLAVGVLAMLAFVRRDKNSIVIPTLPNVRAGFGGTPSMRSLGVGLLGMTTVILLITLIFTASRSAMLGLLLGVGLAMLVAKMKSTAMARTVVIPIAAAVIGCTLLAVLFVPNIIASLRGGGVTEDRSLIERIAQYDSYPLVVDSPWLHGHGVGAYTIAAYEAHTCTGWDCQPIHNVPMLIIGELGVVGLIVVLAWSTSIDRINFARFPNRDALVAFAMGNVVLVVLFFDHYLWSSWSGLALIAFVMALTVRMGEDVVT